MTTINIFQLLFLLLLIGFLGFFYRTFKGGKLLQLWKKVKFDKSLDQAKKEAEAQGQKAYKMKSGNVVFAQSRKRARQLERFNNKKTKSKKYGYKNI